MSHADVIPSLPIPTIIECPPAPTKPKAMPMGVKPIPFQIEEKDSLSEMLSEEVVPIDETVSEYREDIMDFIECVFYNKETDMLYKLFTNGTWEALKFLPREQ